MKQRSTSDLTHIRRLYLLLALQTLAGWALVWVQMWALVSLSMIFRGGQAILDANALRFLGIFLGGAGVGIWLLVKRQDVEGRLSVASLRRLEDEVAYHLLRQPDRFYDQYPPQALLGGLSRDLLATADASLERMRCAGAMGDVLVVLIFFMMRDIQGAALLSIGIAMCAFVGGALAYGRSRRAADHADRCSHAEDEVRRSLAEFLEARAEIHLSGQWRGVVAMLGNKAEKRSEAYLDQTRARSEMDLIMQGGQLLTLVLFFGAGAVDLGGVALLLPVLLREIPRVFTRSGRVVELLGRLEESRRAALRIAVYRVNDGLGHADDIPPDDHGLGSNMAELRVQGLTRIHRLADGKNGGGIQAVNFHLEPGTFAVLKGTAGSGKTTLVRTIVGMEPPDAGQVFLGDAELTSMTPEARARHIAFLPQRASMIAGDVRDNLVFASAPWGNDGDELKLIDATGLGRFLRVTALLLEPDEQAWSKWLMITDGMPRREDGPPWVMSNSRTLFEILRPSDDFDELRERRPDGAIFEMNTEACSELRRLGQSVFASQAGLFSFEDYESYRQLSPVPLTERQWRRKRSILQRGDGDWWVEYTLASTHAEIVHALGKDDSEANARLNDLLQGLRRPAGTERRQEPSWKAALESLRDAPSVAGGMIETLLDWADGLPGIRDFLTLQGLGYQVGTSGQRLSGGQLQMVALTRALRRNAALTILDEPTSAMDAAAKERVGDLLANFANGRIVLVISHDESLSRAAHELIEMREGRIAGTSRKNQPDTATKGAQP